MLDPSSLYAVNEGIPPSMMPGKDPRRKLRSKPAHSLVLVHALQGFVDAGSAATLVGQHLLDTLEHDVLVTFNVDELIDYRSRRPPMVYEQDHYASYEAPQLVIHSVRDLDGTLFLLLTGPEPDVQWERFVAAIRLVIENYTVASTIGLHAIGMAVPHTRPVGVITHANRAEMLPQTDNWPGTLRIPGSAAGLLELRLGEWSHDALGFVAQVPHYLAETTYPQAAAVLLDRLAKHVGLNVPRDALQSAADHTQEVIAEQVAVSEEVSRVVSALEQQYDASAGLRGGAGLLATMSSTTLPSADELGAEVERFLATGDVHGGDEPPTEPIE